MEGFKTFILRGNVVDLAIGIAIGAGFNNIVNALVKDIITPIVGAIIKTPSFAALTFTIRGSNFAIGDVLNQTITFFIEALVIYFLIVLPMNELVEKFKDSKPADPTDKKCPECLSDIPIGARRCKFCTVEQPPSPFPAPGI